MEGKRMDTITIVNLPVVQILLLSVMFLAVIVEIKTGGLGIGVLLGMVAAAVFWGSQYSQGLINLYHIAVFLAGILAIVLEIILPTIGLLAGIGIAAMLYSVILALGGDISAMYAIGIAIAISIVVFFFIASKLPSSRLWNKVVLHEATTSEQGYVSAEEHQELIGKQGIVMTELRPAGTVVIDGNPIDVVSEGIYIEKNAPVVVHSVQGNRIVVRKI